MNTNNNKIAIIVDSACDLPTSYIEENNIHIIPINVQFIEKHFADKRDEQATSIFYRTYANNKTADIRSSPPSVEQIRNLLIEEIAEQYKSALVMCLTSTRSDIYKNTKQAALIVPKILRDKRNSKEHLLKSINVIDTHTLFSGQGILAYAAIEFLKENSKATLLQLSEYVTHLSEAVYTYATTDDLFYPRYRGRRRGENSINLFIYMLAKLFDIKPIGFFGDGKMKKVAAHRGQEKTIEKLFNIAENAIHSGLKIPAVTISYAGNLEDIKKIPRYLAFQNYAKQQKIEILLSVMSVSAGIYSGPRAITLSFCPI